MIDAVVFIIVPLAIVAAVAGGAGAYCYGLYLGEKGRRIAAENLLTIGTPERGNARRTARGPSSDELIDQQRDEQAVQKIAAGLKAMAQAEHRHVTDADLQAEARRMLREQDGGAEGMFG